MKCPQCVEEGKRSRVVPGMSARTCMYALPGYYDEDGKWVPGKDPNTTITQYSCSEGHSFTEAK